MQKLTHRESEKCQMEKSLSKISCKTWRLGVGRSFKKAGYQSPFTEGDTEALSRDGLHKVTLGCRAKALSQRCCWLADIPRELTAEPWGYLRSCLTRSQMLCFLSLQA